ncbi:MAG: hypothetical protein HY092_02840 [Candidatus Kerfeldbacteria bacterium]|nr:hypothetical protein [Candidatus Kerfeldbacteria bacterium]
MKKVQTLVIAAGGRGSRIANHFNKIHFRGSKVLFPIADKPFIGYLIDLALALKFRRVFLLTSHFEADIRRYMNTYYLGSKKVIVVYGGRKGRKFGVPYLLYSIRKSLKTPFIYTDGNILFAPELLRRMQSGRLGKNSIALAVSKRDYAPTHSRVTIADGEIKDIYVRLSKRKINRSSRQAVDYFSMGVMAIHPKVFSLCHDFAHKLDLDNVIKELYLRDSELIKPVNYKKDWLAIHLRQDLDSAARQAPTLGVGESERT